MIRVLVVDDHPVLRSGLAAVFGAEPGFRCVGVAADGDELRAALEHAEAEVVILDRHLRDEDGLELCAELRARTAAPAVVIYTAEDEHDLRAAAGAAGAHAVVEKSSGVEVLFDTVRLAAR